MRKLNLHILFEHDVDQRPFGCSYIRLIQPLIHPANQTAFDVSYSTEYRRADIIIIERTWHPFFSLSEAETLVRRIRKHGAHLIFAADDDLLDLCTVSTNDKMIVRYLAREASGIIVSTKTLKERFSRLNPSVIEVPNQLDEHLFSNSSNRKKLLEKEKFVIGYMGTLTHDGDLMMVYQALRTILRKYDGQIEFQLVGGVSDPAVLRAFDGLPLNVLSIPINDISYPKFVPWMIQNIHWDLAIAPLEDNHFSRHKSDLKFLDYSALRIPGIYSQMPVYEMTVKHLENGFLAQNTPAAWIDALECLIEDPSLRKHLATSAQLYVFSQRTLEHRATDWQKAILNLIE